MYKCTLNSYYSNIKSPNLRINMLLKRYSTSEEWLNSITHGIGLIAAIVGLIFMVFRADSTVSVSASAIYGTSLIIMFLCSTVYHAVQYERAKKWLKLFDHSAIYLLIAGTYTPILLISIGGKLGLISMIAVWTLALCGVVFKCFARHRFPKISVMTYLLLGWFALIIIQPLYKAMPSLGLWFIVAGGLSFSFGVLFYIAKSKKYTHAIWHLFVMLGCGFHYFSIYHFVI